MKEPPSLQGPNMEHFREQQLKLFTTLHCSRNLGNPGMQKIWIRDRAKTLMLSLAATPN